MLSLILMTVKGIAILATAIFIFIKLLRPEDARWIKDAPLKIFIGLFLIGMLGHYVWLLYAAIFLCIPLLSRTRAEAAALYAIAYVAAPIAQSKLMVGGTYLFPINRYTFCALGLLVAWCIKPAPERKLSGRLDIPFLIALVLEYSQARDPVFGLMMRNIVPLLVSVVLPYFLISRSLNSAADIRQFLLALGFGAFVLGVVAITESRLHFLIYKQIEANLHVTNQINAFQQIRGGALRAPGSFLESTSLGNFLAVGVMALLALRSSFASVRHWYWAVGILLVGLLAPNSRGAFLGAGVGFLAFFFYCRRWMPFFLAGGSALCAYLVALMLAPYSQFVATMVGKGAGIQLSTDYRVQLFTRGMEEIRKHPLLGVPLQRALDNLEDIRQSQHIIDLVNAYISYGLTLGYPGIIGLVLVFVSLCGGMFLARRKLAVNPDAMNAAAFVFSVSAFMIGVVAFTTFGGGNSNYFYETCALGSAIWAVRHSRYLSNGPAAGGASTQAVGVTGVRAMIERDRKAAMLRS